MSNQSINVKDVLQVVNDYTPKVYLLAVQLGLTSELKHFAFSTQVDRILFEKNLTEKYAGPITFLHRSEVLFNPRVSETIDRLNEDVL